MIYSYNSPIGPMKIVPHNNRWMLYICEESVGSYHSPAAAADAVFTQHTDFDEWDECVCEDIPAGINSWLTSTH